MPDRTGISVAFSLSVSECPPPSPHCASQASAAPSIPHMSETHSIQPLLSPTSSFTCSQIYFSLSLSPGQPIPLPASRLSAAAAAPLLLGDSLITLYQSGFGGPDAVQHRFAQALSAPISASLPYFYSKKV